MINTKKSRKSIVALSIIAAFVMCTFATTYAFAANPDNKTADTKTAVTVNNIDSELPVDEVYPVDLEYFKNWQGWDKEWENYLEYLEKSTEDYLLERYATDAEKYKKMWEEHKEWLEDYNQPEYWDESPWKKMDRDGGRMFKLKDGTEIETGNVIFSKQDWYAMDLTKLVKETTADTFAKYMSEEIAEKVLEHLQSVTLKSFTSRNNIKASSSPGNGMGLMIPLQKSIVRLANGITIETPVGTLIVVRFDGDEPEMEITIGIDHATITQPDGKSSTVTAGVIIDGEGNIIK